MNGGQGLAIKRDEAHIRAVCRFSKQYGYDWKKEIDPNHIQVKAKTDSRVFYYTTVGTFHKFAENGCLWASHIKRMNDWKEFELGRDQVLQVLKHLEPSLANEEVRQRFTDAIADAREIMRPAGNCPPFGYGREYVDYWQPEVYNLSFTTREDLLSQWKMYARESGVAVELDFSRASTFWQKTVHSERDLSEKDTMDFKREYCLPRHIDYQTEQLRAQIQDTIQQTEEDPDLFVWKMIYILEQIPFFKHSGFSQEGESRLIFRPYKRLEPDDSITYSKVGYREAGHILVPYLEIYCGSPADPKANLADSIGWPVVSLTVGPGHDQDVVFESLVHRLEFGRSKFRAYSENELFWAQKTFYQNFSDQYPGAASLRPILMDLRKRKGETDPFQTVKKFFSDHPELRQEYDDYCTKQHLCSNGILIKKSQIPYIFS